MRKPYRIDAIIALVGPEVSGRGDGSEVHYHAGQTPPSDSAIDAKLAELEAEYDAQEYARKRQAEYPPWNEQLDKIFHDGLAKWKSEMVQPVKDKYPKPE